jgi:hypothetical protein
MKSILFATIATVLVAGCAVSNSPATAWGKEGVSMLDYRTDGGQCAVLAATATPETNAAHTAGGLNNTVDARMPEQVGGGGSPPPATAGGAPTPPAASGTAFPTGGGGMYRDSADPDTVSRAATQQQTREMAMQRARVEALKYCLSDRGYTEFTLTPEQRAHLETLAQGSDERRAYLAKARHGSADAQDTASSHKQPVAKKQPAAQNGN